MWCCKNCPLLALVLLLQLGCEDRGSVQQRSLNRWLEQHAAVKSGSAAGLYHAYYSTDRGKPGFISPMISAQVARYYLQLGFPLKAINTGRALLGWQHMGDSTSGDRLLGAFPCEIEPHGEDFRARYRYDSNDTLAVMALMLDLHEHTGEERFLHSARLAGNWLRDVMVHGERYGVWTQDHGAPMKTVTDSGDFDNRIPVGRSLFWLPTLRRLSELTGDSSFAGVADRATDFLLGGASESGGYYDNYDPGWPPKPYSVLHFATYLPQGSVVADDSLRAAIAAERMELLDSQHFLRWLPHKNGAVPGYINLDTGAMDPDNIYYDLFSSALLRDFLRGAGLDATAAASFVADRQSENGGWYWGYTIEGDQPVDDVQSTLTGIWAVSSLFAFEP